MKNIHFVFTMLFCLLFAVGLTASEAGPELNTPDGFSLEMSAETADVQVADLQVQLEVISAPLAISDIQLMESEIAESPSPIVPLPASIRADEYKRTDRHRSKANFIFQPSKINRYDKVTTAPPAHSNWYAIRGYWPQ